jgi:integrase
VPDLSVLRRYRLALMQDLAPATVNQHLCRVRGAYLNALQLGMIDRDPTVRVKYLDLERNEPKPLTNEEARRVLAACRDDREHLLVLALAYTGMRKSEVAGLRWEAIDFEAQTIRLEAAETKTNTGRTVPLHPRLAKALLAAIRPYSGTYVFETNRRGPMSGSHAHRLMVRLLARARVETDQPWHVWRKTLAGTLRENDVSGDVIDAICGWAPRGMQLQRYARVSLRQKLQAIVRAYRDDPLERVPLGAAERASKERQEARVA